MENSQRYWRWLWSCCSTWSAIVWNVKGNSVIPESILGVSQLPLKNSPREDTICFGGNNYLFLEYQCLQSAGFPKNQDSHAGHVRTPGLGDKHKSTTLPLLPQHPEGIYYFLRPCASSKYIPCLCPINICHRKKIWQTHWLIREQGKLGGVGCQCLVRSLLPQTS